MKIEGKHYFDVNNYWNFLGPDFYSNGTPPAFISSATETIYHHLIETKYPGAGGVLVFGATPMLRKIVGSLSVEASVADFSKLNIETAASGLDAGIRAKEKHLIANWLDLDKYFDENAFSLAVGDLIFRQVAPPDCSRLVSISKFALIPGGIFIVRSSIKNPVWASMSAEEILKFSANLATENSLLTKRLIISLALFRLRDKWTDKLGAVSPRELKADVLEVMNSSLDHRVVELASQVFNAISESSPINWTHLTENQFYGLVSGHFSVEERICAADYPDAEFFPIYVLKKK